jgi:single-strand DNA-binding protein
MASFNKVVLMGNLTRDPQMKYLPSQMACTEFGLAINRKFRTAQGEDREDVTFVDCTAFGRTGEAINQYCTKGKPLFVEGRLKYDSWDDKQGGGKRSKITVVVENFQFIGGREPGAYGSQDDQTPAHDAADEDQTRRQTRHPVGARGGANQTTGYQRPLRQQHPDNREFKEDDIPF